MTSADGFAASEQDLQTAIDRYHDLLRDNPYDIDVITNLAWIYERAREYPQSIQQFKQALEINGEHIDANFGLGLAQMGNQQMDDAIEQFERTYDLVASHDDRSVVVTVQHQCEVYLRRLRG